MVTSPSYDASSLAERSSTAPKRRDSVLQRIDQQLWQFRENASPQLVSLLLIDLDNFRLINELCGHSAGDQVIETVLQRCAQVSSQLHVIHLGADEFACLFAVPPSLCSSSPQHTAALVEQIMETLSQPISLNTHMVHLTASIGIYNNHCGKLDTEELVRSAAIALKHAKARNGNAACHFQPDMLTSISKRAILEEELRSGLRRGELVPFYQPIVSLTTRKTTHFEALVRWRHPTRGTLAPGQFLDVAQEAGLNDDLLFSILRQTCGEARKWHPQHRLSVNMSPPQVCDPNIAERLIQTVFASGLPPERLMMEITENAVLNDHAGALKTITLLHKAGIRIALDDFGTGYASLSRICNLPLDMLKIDKSLVQAMDSNNGCKLVKAVIDLGRSLGMPVISEGIETPEQADLLTEMGCEFGQGFWFGRPAPMTSCAPFTQLDKNSHLLTENDFTLRANQGELHPQIPKCQPHSQYCVLNDMGVVKSKREISPLAP